MEETEYRMKIKNIFDHLSRSLDAVDPDLLECDYSQGSLTLKFADQSRCILSAQPSVRQLWMAVASRGIAHHFNFDSKTQEWKDDKSGQVEALSYLESLIQTQTGLQIHLTGTKP
jgi:iron donor protein CyaY